MKIRLIVLLIACYTLIACSQTPLKLKDTKSALTEGSNVSFDSPVFHKFRNTGKAGMPAILIAAIILVVINPMMVVENKKVYFGLTKEISIGKYPYGRIAFEYSYIFRDYSHSQFRISYNQDFAFNTRSDFLAPMLSGGAGYFTDTYNKGFFVQGGGGVLLPMPLGFTEGVIAYIKARETFVKSASNIFDLSLGMTFLLYY